MKKLLCVLLFVCLFASTAFASHRVGVLKNLNVTEEEFQRFVEERQKNGQTQIFSTTTREDPVFVFFDTFMAMQMALNAGNIDEILLPEDTAEYLINVTEKYYYVACVVRTTPITLNFGFRANDDPALKNKFNEAIMSMKADGTLAILEDKYIANAGIGDPEPVELGRYENIDKTITVAVTGDIPPIDFVNAEGKPAGFSTAVIAEIAKRLKINVELVNIDAGARASSLASGRSDVVFWFQSYKNLDGTQPDIPKGIVLSEPYYQWNEFFHIAKR
ncbi:MAG: transporter substrate-binding domain-containing protein [Synergistaceae bacterium]|nr:transporter substrate-binding domain-containing protein [Synergistaceae bacterium]